MSARPDKWREEEVELELDWGSRAPRTPGAEPLIASADPAALAEVPSGEAGRGPPGDPRYMSHELRTVLAPLLEGGVELRMRQLREWGEILIGWEARNRYEVCDAEGRPLVYVGEAGDGWGSALLRNFWPFRRVRLECMTLGGTLALAVERPWTFFFARAEVLAWDGRLMGTLQQRFSLLRRRLEVLSPGGVVMATVEGPLWRPWTFLVRQRGEEVAAIRKRWGGLLHEAFTDADTFGVELRPECTDARLRQLLLGVALLVDLTYFENRQSSQGASGFLPNVFSFFD
jgi:hypothetical protein